MKYSQLKAFKAIVRAALKAIVKSPSSIIFTVAFPMIFILVFGFLGRDRDYKINIASTPSSDTLNDLYRGLRAAPGIYLQSFRDSIQLSRALTEGDIQAVIHIESTGNMPDYKLKLITNEHNKEETGLLAATLKNLAVLQDPQLNAMSNSLISLQQVTIQEKKKSPVDFILPGQLGFSLLAASIFGTAFVFFNLRQGLVLKRFFATPVKREVILVAEGFARMLFQLLGAFLIIMVGYLWLDFTLAHGAVTVINMLILCALGLLVFMSFGFIISGLAKSESTIPPLSNILTLPQFLLAGTFFPITEFPGWLQVIARILPLTYLNDALRLVAFEGAGLGEVKYDMLILLLWGVLGYFLASKTFKWE